MAEKLSPDQSLGYGKPIRMLLVSQRNGLCCQLASPQTTLEGFDLVGEATTCQEALRRCGRLQPAVILVDLRAPKIDDLSPLSTIHQRWPQVRIVVLASQPLGPDLERLRKQGVVHCQAEEGTTRKLSSLLQNHHHDRLALASDNGSNHPWQAKPHQTLSNRERQVLGRMIMGQDSQAIATELDLNELTARVCMQNLLGKLRAMAPRREPEPARQRTSQPNQASFQPPVAVEMRVAACSIPAGQI
jgi:NarL family two-component system response regulator LiaR